MLLANGAESLSFVLVDMIVTRVVCSKNFFHNIHKEIAKMFLVPPPKIDLEKKNLRPNCVQ